MLKLKATLIEFIDVFGLSINRRQVFGIRCAFPGIVMLHLSAILFHRFGVGFVIHNCLVGFPKYFENASILMN